MLNPELKTPFRWYYSDGPDIDVAFKRQLRFRLSSDGKCYYKLYTHNNRLNPFQIFIPDTVATLATLQVNEWYIYRCDYSPFDTPPSGHYYDLSSSISLIENLQAFGVGIWHIYKGDVLPIVIDSGYWYSFMVLDDGSFIVSEIFYIPCDETEFNSFTKLEWFNSCDFSRHIYQTGYKNVLYITSDLAKNEPTVEEEGYTNGEGVFIQTNAIYYDNYKLQELVPEFVLNAVLALKMHDNVTVTKPFDLYTGKVRNTETSISWQEDNYEAIVDISFQQEIDLSRTGCCDNVIFSPLIPLDAINDSFYVVPMTGISTFYYNVLSNDLGYDLELIPPLSGNNGSGTTWTLNLNGSITINKSTGIGAVTPLALAYSVKDGFEDTDNAVLVINYANANAVDDSYIFGVILEGTIIEAYSVLNNDILPIPAGVLPPPPFYVVDNVGIQIAPSGDYIDLRADGTFTYYQGPNLGASPTFTYILKSTITGDIIDSANIYIENTG